MARRFIMMKRHGSGGLLVSGVALVLTLVTLLAVPAAQAQVEDVVPEALVLTPPAKVIMIEQAQSATSGGVTFFRLEDVSCPGQGFFLLRSTTAGNSKQPLQLEILLTAIERGYRVRAFYDTASCFAATVMVCAAGFPCS